MQCPIDGAELVMTERSGVEIDYCPKCRGVWLDRGELDKIIDRADPAPGAAPDRAPSPAAAGTDSGRRTTGEGAQASTGRSARASCRTNLFDF